MLKLNVGCGLDYREGFVNIDGSDVLPKVDKIINLCDDSLLNHFEKESVNLIVAKDFISAKYIGLDFLEHFKNTNYHLNCSASCRYCEDYLDKIKES